MKKINLAVILGGKSAEHEVSLSTALNITRALDPDRYQVYLIAIDKKGHWHMLDSVETLAQAVAERKLSIKHGSSTIAFLSSDAGAQVFDLVQKKVVATIEVVFPALHGPFGEDGALQGYLKTINVAFVGPSILGSAVGMDKDVMKRLLKEAGLPIGKFAVFSKNSPLSYDACTHRLGSPVFVKAANMGSSIGVYKVRSQSEWHQALRDAFEFDHKVVVEALIQGREVECSVLGNLNPKASLPGEVKSTHDFYSYEAKYLDEKGAELVIPAKLSESVTRRVRELAIQTFQVLCCEGLGRVDFFVQDDGEVFINEINTLPGFTQISMYPKMWEASGLSYTELVDALVRLGQERFARDQGLKTTRE